jgi:hypothetical protein
MGHNGVKTYVNSYHELFNRDHAFCGVEAEERVKDLKIASEALCSRWDMREEVVGDLIIKDRCA